MQRPAETPLPAPADVEAASAMPSGSATRRSGLLAEAIDAGAFGFVLLSGKAEVLHANQAACELLGRSEHDLIGQTIRELLHPDDLGWAVAELELLLAGRIDRIRLEARFLDAAGREVWAELNTRAARAGGAVRAIAMLEDVGDRALRERELRRLADTDPLTELYNRRRFDAELERHLAWTRRYGPSGALLVLDIDSLKRINDAFGHLAGDRAIVCTARALRSRIRASDAIARLGGDEFAVLLPAADHDRAASVAHALLEAIRTQQEPGNRAAFTVSIGVATMTDDMSTADLLERADAAMYAIKGDGGDGCAVASDVTSRKSPASPIGEPQPDRDAGGTGNRALLTDQAKASQTYVDFDVILRTVAELGSASVGVVSWELYADAKAVMPFWSAAIGSGFLKRDRYDRLDHEWQYRITTAGQARLRELEPTNQARPPDEEPRSDGRSEAEHSQDEPHPPKLSRSRRTA